MSVSRQNPHQFSVLLFHCWLQLIVNVLTDGLVSPSTLPHKQSYRRSGKAAAGQFQTNFFDRHRVQKLTVQSEFHELIFHAADVTWWFTAWNIPSVTLTHPTEKIEMKIAMIYDYSAADRLTLTMKAYVLSKRCNYLPAHTMLHRRRLHIFHWWPSCRCATWNKGM